MNDSQVMHAMVLDDTYRTERVLARGEGGVTELVTIDGAGPFVRKKIPSELARRRVWSELAECSCARLPHIDATYELPDQFVVVYDFVPGEPLERQVRNNGPLGPSEAIAVARQVCEAADELHRHGIVHRDISPSNIVLAADGAHLIDLGIARMRVDGAPHDTTSLGTWGYASPEQYGFAQTDARSDVYSIGSVLGFLVTGVRPGDEDYEEALQKAALPDGLRSVMAKARAFEPSSRYQSAAEMAEALGRGESEAPVANTAEPHDDAPNGVSERADAAPAAGASAPRSHKPASSKITSKNGWHPVRDARQRRRRKRIIACVCAFVVTGALAIAIVLGQNGGASTPASDSSASANAKTQAQGSGSASTSGSGTTSEAKAGGTSSAENESKAARSSAGKTVKLELLESGWSCGESGYISFGASIKNASADTAIEYPAVRVTGYDKTGKVLFSNEHMLSIIEPGQTISFADIDGNGTAPDHVAFEAVDPDPDWFTAPQDTPVLSVHNVQETPLDSNEASFGGTLSLDSAPDGFDPNQVRFNVILRDADGKICGGITDFMTCPKLGQSVPFSVRSAALPSYTSYEIYAMAW